MVSTTTANDSGAYQFALTHALAGGNYAIKTVPQTSVIPTSQNPTYVYVVSGQWVDEVDFGFVSGSGPMITDMAAGPQAGSGYRCHLDDPG